MDKIPAGGLAPQLEPIAALFGRGAYLACHEALEALWLAEPGPARGLYQGLLQAATALFHESRRNRAGACKLLRSSLGLLAPLAPDSLGLDLEDFRAQCRRALAALESSPAPLDPALAPRLRPARTG